MAIDLELRAQRFATHAHRSQVRKYSGDPYIIHPEAVAALVRSVPHTEEQLAAAWLHDTVEDCGVQLDEILALFGAEVATLVGWLTDASKPTDGNRARRKEIDRQHTAQAPAAAKTVKLADLIDNTRSIVARDPDFARVYLREKAALLQVLREGDGVLHQQATNLLAESWAVLKAGRRPP